MASESDLHQVIFEWPHPEPQVVIVTGTFDQWSSSVHLTKSLNGFSGSAKIPWGEKINYKFIVDGEWIVHENQPTETDPGGFVNNVYAAPPKPPTPTLSSSNGDALHILAQETEASQSTEPTIAPSAEKEGAESQVSETSEPTAVAANAPTSGFPQLLSDLASTVIARDGTSSALGYVASGLGAVVHSVVGVDPINAGQIAIPTPKVDDEFDVPSSASTVGPEPELETSPSALEEPISPSSSNADTPSSPVAPRVPILIVPVNATENTTVGSPPSSLQPDFVLPSSHSASIHIAKSADKTTEADVKPVVIEDQTAVEDAVASPSVVAETKVQEEPAVAVEEVAKEEVAEELKDITAESTPAVSAETLLPEVMSAPLSDIDNSPVVVQLEEPELKSEPTTEVEELKAEMPVQEISGPVVEEPILVQESEDSTVTQSLDDPAPSKESAVDEPTKHETLPESLLAEGAATVAESNIEDTPKQDATAPPVAEVEATSSELAQEAPVEETHEPVSEAPIQASEGVADAVAAAAILAEEDSTAAAAKEAIAAELYPEAFAAKQEEVDEKPSTLVVEETPRKEPTAVVSEVKVEDTNGGDVKGKAGIATPTAPSTPVKGSQKAFPALESTTASPSSSKFSTQGSTRKKRTSIFGKFKNIFHHDKEEKEKESGNK